MLSPAIAEPFLIAGMLVHFVSPLIVARGGSLVGMAEARVDWLLRPEIWVYYRILAAPLEFRVLVARVVMALLRFTHFAFTIQPFVPTMAIITLWHLGLEEVPAPHPALRTRHF